MKKFFKILAGIFFTLFLLIFVLLTTVKFEIFNSGFFFGSLERNGIYQKQPGELAKSLPNDPNIPAEEKEDYAKIVSNISPSLLQKILEENLGQIIDFVNGSGQDLNLSVSASTLGIPGGNLAWKMSDHFPDKTTSFWLLQGVGNKLLIVWLVLLLILGGLLKVVGPKVLLIDGILLTVVGLLARLFLLVITSTFPAKAEPSQVLLKLLSVSVLGEITLSWLIMGVILTIVYVVVRKTLIYWK